MGETPATVLSGELRGAADASAAERALAEAHGELVSLVGRNLTAVWLGEDRRREAAAAALGLALDPAFALRGGLDDGAVRLAGGRSVEGAAVEWAQRLRGANKFFSTAVVASEAVFSRSRERLRGRLLGLVRFVGGPDAIRVYQLLDEAAAKRWEKALPVYDEARTAFSRRDFARAAKLFGEVARLIPGDRVSSLYGAMSEDYRALPPTDGWDGAFNLTSR